MSRLPNGLAYEPNLLSSSEEAQLLHVLDALEFQEIRMRGQVARRTALHYGIAYDYDNPGRVDPGEPFPDWLLPVRDRCAGVAGVEPAELVEGLVQRYPAGATIGWHRDAPQFGHVVGVSLGGACRLRLRHIRDHDQLAELTLEPRSAYLLSGAARWQWQHSIPPAKELRYSITFRTLRRR